MQSILDNVAKPFFLIEVIKINILELIYPKTCGMCEEISKSYICNKCKLKLKKLLKLNTIHYKDKYFNSHTYLFKYEGIIRERLLQYKFREKSYLYKFFSEIILNNCNIINNYDIILSVPIHIKRKIERGYNQSELIANELSKIAGIEFCNNILVKEVNNSPQSTLNKTERMKNVLGIYRVENAQKIQNKSILLLDDIYTTGYTVNECAKVLKQNGADKVSILTLAKD